MLTVTEKGAVPELWIAQYKSNFDDDDDDDDDDDEDEDDYDEKKNL